MYKLIQYFTKHIIIRYVISGGMAGVTDLVLLYLFNGVWGLHYLVAATIAFVGAFFVSFLLHKFWTFESHEQDTHKQLFLYFGNSIFGLVLNTFFMYLFVDHIFAGIFVDNLKFRVLLSQFVVALIVACFTFFISRNYVFKRK